MKKSIFKKWWFWVGVVVFIGLFNAAFNNEEKMTTNNDTPIESNETSAQVNTEVVANNSAAQGDNSTSENKVSEPLNKQAVIDYTSNMSGRSFLQGVEVGEHEINVKFHDDYKSYKAKNPKSAITEEDYVQYLGTGDEINKILMEESARLLKQFPSANTVQITIPFDGKINDVKLDRAAAEKYFSVDFDALNTDPDAWRSQLSDKYFNDTERNKFVNEFVKVK